MNLRFPARLLFFVAFSIYFNQSVNAQLNMQVMDAQSLIQNVLVGVGVQASNITLGGDPQQVGRFTNGNSVSLGISNGVILTTGNIPQQLVGSSTGGNINSADFLASLSTSSYNSVNVTNDPDLNLILNSYGITTGAPGLTNNVSVIEFDFIPSGDSLSFKYIFGSEEYEDYVCSRFFDAFGFFLSGPGITGPYSNNSRNLALVPNTNLPVGINTINDGFSDGGEYCGDNGLDNFQYYAGNPRSDIFSVNGFTTPLTAAATVQCGQTYHIKIVIANGSDGTLDSWVFLQGGSFSSTIPDVYAANLLPDGSIVEGCTESPLMFIRTNSDEELTINLNYGGTAINGVDYDLLPTTLFFGVGVDTVTYILKPIDDGINEEVETVIISFSVINDCGDTVSVERTIKIRDPYALKVVSSDIVASCPSDNYEVNVEVTGGYPPYNFLWEVNGSTQSSLIIPLTGSQSFPVTISDSLDCSFAIIKDTVNVTLNYVPMTLKTLSREICLNDSVTLKPLTLTGKGPFSVVWEGFGNSPLDSIRVSPSDTTAYPYIITDVCGFSISATAFVYVPDYLPIMPMPIDTTVCKGETALLTSNPSGGNRIYTYEWSGPGTITAINDSVSSVLTSTQTKYYLKITDGCGAIGKDSMMVSVQSCELTVGNAFSPNADGKNDFFEIANIQFYPNNMVYVYNRWGNKIFEESGYNNTWNGGSITSGTYFYVIDPGDGSSLIKGTVTVFKN